MFKLKLYFKALLDLDFPVGFVNIKVNRSTNLKYSHYGDSLDDDVRTDSLMPAMHY